MLFFLRGRRSGGAHRLAFNGAENDIARTEPHRERQRQHDAAKKNAKGKIDNLLADFEMIERHGRRQHQDQPLHAQTQEPRILQIHIHCADENAARQEPRHDVAHQQNDCRRQSVLADRRAAQRNRRVRRSAKGIRADGDANGYEGPEDQPRGKPRRRLVRATIP